MVKTIILLKKHARIALKTEVVLSNTLRLHMKHQQQNRYLQLYYCQKKLQLYYCQKKQSRKFENFDNKDYETSILNCVKKSIMTTTSSSKKNEKHVSQSKSKVIDSMGSGGKRERVMEMSVMEKNSEGGGKRKKVLNMRTREKSTLVS